MSIIIFPTDKFAIVGAFDPARDTSPHHYEQTFTSCHLARAGVEVKVST